MIRIDKIKEGLFGRVGFMQPDIAEYAIVSEANMASASGLTFQDASAIVSIKNIIDTQPTPNATSTQINSLLTRIQSNSILDVCNKALVGKPDYIKSVNPYPFAKSFKNTLGKNGKFVAIKFTPTSLNMSIKVSFGEIAIDETETFNLYVYNSNVSTPIETIEVESLAGQSKVFDVNIQLADETTYKGGSFYIGYFDDDIIGEAYSRDYERSSFRIDTPYLNVTPVHVAHVGTTIDISSESYQSETFGLNFGVEIYNDYTDLILKNKSIFDRAIQLQGVIRMMDMIKNSTRSNIEERLMKQMIDDANFALYGNSDAKIKGITQMLSEEIDHIRKMLFPTYRISKGTLST